MKRILFFVRIIGIGLLLTSCKRDCNDLRPGKSVPFSDELRSWMRDSATLDFRMVDDDGSEIDWLHVEGSPDGRTSSYECTEKPKRRHELAWNSFRYSCLSTGEAFSIALRTYDEFQYLEVIFNDVKFHYAMETHTAEPQQTDEGLITATATLLNTYPVRGRLWPNVLALETTADFVTYPKVWIAQGWGMVRYENQYGKVWERLP